MVDATSDEIKNALVTLAIEQTLLEFGTPALEKVNKKLLRTTIIIYRTAIQNQNI